MEISHWSRLTDPALTKTKDAERSEEFLQSLIRIRTMANKTKKRRTFASTKYNEKTRVESTTSKPNPFDLHVNRLKHDVLGKKRNYERGGQPLKARSRGIEKRKRTLLKEYKSVFKNNTFVDQRIGERDPTLTAEERAMQRLIAERSKAHLKKESRYNLNDEEDLTHYGQSLAKSDLLNQKPVVDDFDDENDKGRVNAEHFFGGFDSANEKRKPQSKKEWIEDMIKTTKLDKFERQRENEKVFDMTETLDEQWRALSTLIGVKEKRNKETKETHDDYDKLVASLRFEAKTTGAPVKSIEEQRKETAERLKTLQTEEVQRMEKPIVSKNKSSTYRSVEELDESYYIMDGTKKRVTFDDENEQPIDIEMPLITENENEEENGEEEEETTNGADLIAEFDEIPSTVEKLENRLREDKSTLGIVWKRINDKRLPAIPKSVLSNYFDVLLDYFDSITTNSKRLSLVAKNLLQLLQLVNNDQTRENIIERLKQNHENFKEKIECDKFAQLDLNSILFLKLIAYLYPTSDFRHPITTPALTFLVQSIQQASLRSLTSCRQALLLVDLAKQWISKSQRYIPEVIVLLIKLVQMSCQSEKFEHFLLCSSKQIGHSQLLFVENDENIENLSLFDPTELDDENVQHRTFILKTTLEFIEDFLRIYQSLSSIIDISRPFRSILSQLVQTCKSSLIKSKCEDIQNLIGTFDQIERNVLTQGKVQTKILPLFEPRFGPVYEGKKNTRAPKEHVERTKLRKNLKRVTKSTVRNLILDTQFLAREELKDQLEKDAQRKRKVKSIQAELSMQEGEYRKMKKAA